MLAAGLAVVALVALRTERTDAQHVMSSPRRVIAGDAGRTDAGASDAANEVRVLDAPMIDRPRAEGLYERLCAPCHGLAGEGNGPLAGFLAVAPRDFVHQPFKWRSTATGSRPTVDDVARVIARGVPGSSMPGFGAALDEGDRTVLARYVLALGTGAPGVALPPAPSPRNDAATIAHGAEVYAQLQCATCHGAELRGDGPSAATLHPPAYDLTREAPRGGADAATLLRTLRTGCDGSAMPAFDGVVPNEDLAALASWLSTRVAPDAAVPIARWLPPRAVAARVPTAMHPLDRAHAALDASLWRLPLAPQGNGPAQLTPAERSLAPDRCARCHAQQFAQFRTTVHAAAMGPGVLGQVIDMAPRDAIACQTCHGPLAEQSPALLRTRDHDATEATPSGTMFANPAPATSATPSATDTDTTRANPDYDAALRTQGIVCAACHLRGRERFGPPAREASARLAGTNYPLTTMSRYERGDFCAPCHQHTASDSVAGTPILNTVNEWVQSPYFARGIECQHCHMPDRDHTWRGAHDPDTVRQAIHVYGAARRDRARGVDADVSIENVGAGHAFPGTATPAAVVTLQWLDAAGHAIGTPQRDVIQRHLTWTGRAFRQDFDTRIAPGAARTLHAHSDAVECAMLRVTVEFRPDDFYEGFYRAVMDESHRSAEGRRLLHEAYDHARTSPYVVTRVELPLQTIQR